MRICDSFVDVPGQRRATGNVPDQRGEAFIACHQRPRATVVALATRGQSITKSPRAGAFVACQ
jgi:hypothetical protein